ncbi:GNAT family N-acetyltransferase [Kaistella flava (ex Peng et al. 2021)]|uniref:GNAT family N-acetyltransferase n=1 Tax=Kaistella flava (ex Peng et al. 2021) TaxID=2038776 RepID=A0A7M2Y7Q8_9FLAO|nr:GNAT family N-acetyltransferase [Kaistella flava (ex Peng et al. 2021)]QOW09432.1 GNAT family N-acetyltransferase [Kaistella flava (ex Peng et al. 2021)]
MSKKEEQFHFRRAELDDQETIWEILQQAIKRRKEDGSTQWQDGYPNPETIENDIKKNYGFVLTSDQHIVGYAAVIFDVEPAYEVIEGKWLSDGKYIVVHRVAVSTEAAGMGIATHIFKEIEKVATSENVFSIKVDTNFDNIPMLKILDKLGYKYCGEVHFRESARKAFEKLLN